VKKSVINQIGLKPLNGIIFKAAVQGILVLLMVCSFTIPAPEETEEYSIKAAFIYRFTNYIDWDSLITGNEFVIGVIGPSPVKDELVEISRTKTIKDKKILVLQFNTIEEISACHILFISQKAQFPLSDILSKAERKGTLTISEKPGYAARGTAINFVVVDNKLKFEANPKTINSTGLKASSQLLKLAIIVD